MSKPEVIACKRCDIVFSNDAEAVEHFRRLHQLHNCRACGCPTRKDFCDSCERLHPTEIYRLERIEKVLRSIEKRKKALNRSRAALLNSLHKRHPANRISIYCEHGEIRETCARCAKIFAKLDARRDERLAMQNRGETLTKDIKPLTRMQKARFIHLD